MKTIKKVIALLLTLVMAMSLCVGAFAEEEVETTYSITISGAANGETYNAYKIFTAESSSDGKAVSYKISYNDEWYSVVSTYAATENNGLTLIASAVDSTVYVVTFDTKFSAANFAAYLAQNTSGKTVAGTATAKSGSETTIDVSTSGAGYYFVDTSLGSLCSLDTVSGTNQYIIEKNSVPTITKTVMADGTTGDYGKDATIDIIDDVNYKLTVNTGSNTNGTGTGVDDNYVITDTLPVGITVDTSKIAVGVTVNNVTTTWTLGTDYTVSAESKTNDNGTDDTSDDTQYQVVTITLLSTGALKNCAQNTDIVITYTADVDSTIAVGTDGNTNTAVVKYKNQTNSDTAVVKTYELGNGLTKTDGTNALEGVTFYLKSGDKFAKVDSNGVLTGWVAEATSACNLKTDADGHINVKGLDAGTYTLVEIETLEGYNLLSYNITVTISEAGDVTYTGGTQTTAANTITVINTAGSELPETGGMGTTMFYVVGGLLVAAAAVALIVKKRMSGYED